MIDQTFILQLPNNLSVRYNFISQGVDIVWSRRLYKRDIPSLKRYYTPWRDDLLKRFSNEAGEKITFADLAMIELVHRGKR